MALGHRHPDSMERAGPRYCVYCREHHTGSDSTILRPCLSESPTYEPTSYPKAHHANNCCRTDSSKISNALPSPAHPPALSATVTNSPSMGQPPSSLYGSSPGQGAGFGNLVFAKYCPSLYIQMSRLRLTITRSSWKSVLGIRAVSRFRFRMIRRPCVGQSSAMACRSALTYTRLIARGRVRRV
jgi:hypothetical protein